MQHLEVSGAVRYASNG